MQMPSPRRSSARFALAFGTAGLLSAHVWSFIVSCSNLPRFLAPVLRYRATEGRPVRNFAREMYHSNKQRPETRYLYNAA
jgi:hypothetical protein